MAAALDLNARVRATRLTYGAYKGRPLVWGQTDCAKLIDFHLAGFGRDTQFSQYRPYSTEAGAYKTLRGAKFADTVDWIDSLGLQAITPAMALTGDILAFSLPNAGMSGLAVTTGHRRILGFHRGEATCCLQVLDLTYPDLITRAWRV